ncbi:hypothetical protein Pcinc_036960 [Petrolisthes cinctipes]|uniref:Uncharacterized protein n=1 Tax=Petrolisthes cinctipes TaxID=88211 RepID=A0AAE1EM11_PETCI|nr:hypothetical protein Pcinc_036960 [Petrolisthes cinctipes]
MDQSEGRRELAKIDQSEGRKEPAKMDQSEGRSKPAKRTNQKEGGSPSKMDQSEGRSEPAKMDQSEGRRGESPPIMGPIRRKEGARQKWTKSAAGIQSRAVYQIRSTRTVPRSCKH